MLLLLSSFAFYFIFSNDQCINQKDLLVCSTPPHVPQVTVLLRLAIPLCRICSEKGRSLTSPPCRSPATQQSPGMCTIETTLRVVLYRRFTNHRSRPLWSIPRHPLRQTALILHLYQKSTVNHHRRQHVNYTDNVGQ